MKHEGTGASSTQCHRAAGGGGNQWLVFLSPRLSLQLLCPVGPVNHCATSSHPCVMSEMSENIHKADGSENDILPLPGVGFWAGAMSESESLLLSLGLCHASRVVLILPLHLHSPYLSSHSGLLKSRVR